MIVRRLLFAFGANLAFFAVALGVLLKATSDLDAADAEVARLDRAKAAAYRVAALVREQYIHQAHTIIEGNRSHLAHYEDVARLAAGAVLALRAVADGPDDRARAESAGALVAENDREFHEGTLPAIDADERDRVRELHRASEDVLVRALEENKKLSLRFEQRSDAARDRAERLRKRTRWAALLCFGLSTIIAAAGAIVTTRWIALRVTALRAGARAIGAGHLKSRISLAGNDEFADIGRSIDEMAADLERHQNEMVRAQKLASIGQVAAGVAHEINNPLGVILGYVKTMRRIDRRDDEGLDVIEEEAGQCQRIVAGLLDLAKPQTLTLETVDVGALVRESIDRLTTTAKLRDRVVEVTNATDGVRLEADPGKLRQVLLNVLTNAAEAAAPGGRIEVHIERQQSDVAIEVRDFGPGFSAEVRRKLFEPFVTTKKGGLGLGLAIAHAIVDAHRGRLACESPALGTGTVVRITLPIEATRRMT